MKTIKLTIIAILSAFTLSTATAQESSFSAGVDVVSSYVWRGAQFGSGPAMQPGISFATGGLEIGAWGSNCFSTAEGLEADLYAGYSFDFGLSLGFTDYYFGGDWTDGDMHFFEPTLSYSFGDFSLLGAYMFGDGVEDTYIEASYAFGDVSIFAGVGDGQYTDDTEFNVCNVGITYSKEISITDSFSLPMFGSVVLNPSTGGFYTVVGISL